MRFHFGVSFRLKYLKKFLIPILLGLLTYFGINGLIGFTNVYATANTNPNTYFIYDYPSIDFTTPFGNYTMQQLLDYGSYESQYYYTIPVVEYNNSANLLIVKLVIYPKTITSLNYEYYIYNSSSGTTSELRQYITPNDNSISPRYINLQSNQNATTIQTNLDKYLNCVESNTYCDTMNSSGRLQFGSKAFSLGANNDYDFDINYVSITMQDYNGFIYSSPVPITFISGTNTSNRAYYKSLDYNDTIYQFNDTFYPYFSGGGGSNSDIDWGSNAVNKLDDIFVSNIPKADLSTLSFTLSFNYVDLDFVDNIKNQVFFFGRVNNSNYYSYEPIDCFLPNGSAYGGEDNLYTHTFQNPTCTSSLDNYDQIFIRVRLMSTSQTGSNAIYNGSITTNKGYANTSPIYNGPNYFGIMEYFDALPPNFNILLSTQEDPRYVVFRSNQYYTYMSHVTRDDNKILQVATGSDNTMLFDYGSLSNRNVMIYNYTPSNSNENTNLFVFFGEDTIISSSTTGSFTYYDNTNTLVSGNVNNNYQVSSSNYDLNVIFTKVNSYINGLEENMFDLHNLMQSIYDTMPEILQNVLSILYILALTYLLFKVIRK